MNIRTLRINNRFTNYLIGIIGITIILYFGRSLFIPLGFSAFIAFLLFPITSQMEHKGIPRSVSIVAGLFGILILISLLIALLVQQVKQFAKQWTSFQEYFEKSTGDISNFLAENFNYSLESQSDFINSILNQSGPDLIPALQRTLSVSAISLVLAVLVPVFSYLILYHRERWIDALYYLFPKQGRERIRNILKLTVTSYYNFVKGMIVVYLIVGILNSIGLWILGIPTPFLFGFIASIFTIIPYIGIIVASLLPITIAWITFQSPLYALGVVAIFAFVQYLEAYIIFPMAVSSRLRINTFVTLAVIILGGIIWGVAGMILFIPFLGILKLIADRTPELKFISVLLGSD